MQIEKNISQIAIFITLPAFCSIKNTIITPLYYFPCNLHVKKWLLHFILSLNSYIITNPNKNVFGIFYYLKVIKSIMSIIVFFYYLVFNFLNLEFMI